MGGVDQERRWRPKIVIAGLVPAIHTLRISEPGVALRQPHILRLRRVWVAGTSPAMTE
jgi:hypothetical protein